MADTGLHLWTRFDAVDHEQQPTAAERSAGTGDTLHERSPESLPFFSGEASQR
jgi:hypothetical protein